MPLQPEDLHILMIALSDSVLSEWGDTQSRHLAYASRVGHLHMVVYTSKRQGYPEKVSLSERLTIYPTRSQSRAHFPWDAYRIGRGIGHDHPIKVITTQDPFTTALVGLCLRRNLHAPLLVQNHSDFFDNPHWIVEKPLRYGLFNRLGKVLVRRADVNRVLNRREAAKYAGMGIPAERVKIIPTPVGIDRFTPGPADPAIRTRWGIPPDAPLLLWVGRPGYVKRVETLITALNNLQGEFPTVHLLLVGDFAVYPKVPALVGELKLGVRVCFAGKVAHEDLPGLYRACDLYVHSSLYEGLGMVMIEAGACGKPVVSARTAGAESILVDGETGLLCTIDDPADMAEQIAGLLRDPERARRMGEAARKHIVKTFDPQKNLEAVIASWLYTAQIGKRP